MQHNFTVLGDIFYHRLISYVFSIGFLYSCIIIRNKVFFFRTNATTHFIIFPNCMQGLYINDLRLSYLLMIIIYRITFS